MYRTQISNDYSETWEANATDGCADLPGTPDRSQRAPSSDAGARGSIKRRPELRPVAEILPDISAKTRKMLAASEGKA